MKIQFWFPAALGVIFPHASSSLALTTTTTSPSCPLTFDGRIPQNFTKATFETAQSPFNRKYVLGLNQTWSQVISFPMDVEPSIFDRAAGTKPIEVEITDKSVFASDSEGHETALRRAELLVNGKNQTVSGKYLLAFHEAQDFQADFWSLKVGRPMQEANATNGTAGSHLAAAYGTNIGFRHPAVSPAMLETGSVIYLQGYKWAQPIQTYFLAPFTPHIWHNFGLYLDFESNHMQVAYSTGSRHLDIVTPLLPNNISGIAPTTLGETHWGLQKRPVGASLQDFLFKGEQPHGIHERLAIGGVLQVKGSLRDCVGAWGA
ncbi:hypothetical protein ACJQWK_00226 [Exserohilum turcicum]